MPRFSYTAYDDTGARSAGVIESDTREAAIESLFRQGRYPLELIEGGRAPALRWWEREVFAARGLSRSSLALLTREVATLVKAELPLDEALRITRLQPLMPARSRQVIGRILERVVEGASLSQAIDQEGGSFPAYYPRVVQAGEAAGTLGQSLDELASFLERESAFRARIGSALLYPALLLVAAAATLIIIVTVLIPTVAPLFRDAGAEPPFIIGLLTTVQEAIAAHWLLALLVVAILVAGYVALSRNGQWQLWRDRLLLRTPLLSRLIQNSQTSIMARTLGTLLRNGVPLLQALQIAGDVLSNRAMAAAVRTCAVEVKEGAPLVGSLARSGVFPELALRLTAVGEQTGQLDTMLERVGTIYETALQQQLTRITGLLTPILTIVIGVLVGGLLLSVMSAIVGINDLALK